MQGNCNKPRERLRKCEPKQPVTGVSRRRVIQSIGAAPFAIAAGGVLAQDNRARKPKLALVSRHLQWTDWRSGLEVAREVGYPGIVWTVRGGAHVEPENVARDLPEIVEATRAAGLAVPMIITRIRDASEPHIESILNTFANLGITHYRTGTPRYDYNGNFAAQFDLFRDKLDALQEMNAKYGVTACFHTHSSPGSLGGVGWDLWMVVRDFDPRYIGINFDIGHIVARTAIGWRDIAHAARDHIRSVSLKDVRVSHQPADTRVDQRAWQREFVPPGEGVVAFDDLFEFLHETNFDGPMEVYHEYTAPVPGTDERLDMLGRSFGAWDLEVPPEYYAALLARDVQFYKTSLRNAGYDV